MIRLIYYYYDYLLGDQVEYRVKSLQVTKGLSLHLTVGVTSLDRVRTHYIKGNLGLREIGQKIEERKWGWLRNIVKETDQYIARRVRQIEEAINQMT